MITNQNSVRRAASDFELLPPELICDSLSNPCFDTLYLSGYFICEKTHMLFQVTDSMFPLHKPKTFTIFFLIMNDANELTEMEILFSVLADKTRLRILNLIRTEEICVYYFTEILKESQPKISRHLAYMRNSGIVSGRREGKWINYKINFPDNPPAAILLDDTLQWLATQANMREEHRKLTQTYSVGRFPVNSVEGNPRNTFADTYTNNHHREELDIFLL